MYINNLTDFFPIYKQYVNLILMRAATRFFPFKLLSRSNKFLDWTTGVPEKRATTRAEAQTKRWFG